MLSDDHFKIETDHATTQIEMAEPVISNRSPGIPSDGLRFRRHCLHNLALLLCAQPSSSFSHRVAKFSTFSLSISTMRSRRSAGLNVVVLLLNGIPNRFELVLQAIIE